MPVTRPDIFSPAIKAQGNEGERRILLGDNAGCGPGMLRPIMFQCVITSTGLTSIYAQSILNSDCFRRGVPVHQRR